MRISFTLAPLLALAAPAIAQCTSTSTNFNNAVTGPVQTIATWAATPGAPQRLVIGGDFVASTTNPSAFPCDYIGYWDGSSWRALGWGADAPVHAITTWDPDGPGPIPQQVIAAGAFTHVGADSTGAIEANHIALWNGAAWQPLASGLNGDVLALTSWDPDGPGPLNPWLIAGGAFTHAGDATVDYIAAWDGTTWQGLGWGFNAPVTTLTTWDVNGSGPTYPVLLAGGDFLEAGSDSTGAITAKRFAAWNGTAWSAMNVDYAGSQSPTHLNTFDFDGPGPASPSPVAIYGLNLRRWNGASWDFVLSQVPVPEYSGSYTAIAVVNANASTPSRLWRAAETWHQWWSFDFPLCVEGCTHFETGPNMIWTENGLSQPASAFELTATILEGWDADGDGPGFPQIVAAGPFPGYLQAHPYQAKPAFTQQPAPALAPVGGAASFTCAVDSQDPVTYAWFKATRPNGWPYVSLTDGLQSSGSFVSGSHSATLSIDNIASLDGQLDSPSNGSYFTTLFCRVTNSCGTVDSAPVRLHIAPCSADFNFDGDTGTDADIEAFFACLAGNCCPTCLSADFNADDDTGTDADIEAFFRVLAGGNC